MDFKLTSAYVPTGDQPEAIRQLVIELGETQSIPDPAWSHRVG